MQVAAFAFGRGPLALKQCPWLGELKKFGAVLSFPVVPKAGQTALCCAATTTEVLLQMIMGALVAMDYSVFSQHSGHSHVCGTGSPLEPVIILRLSSRVCCAVMKHQQQQLLWYRARTPTRSTAHLLRH